jgi:hypothetical protein
VTLHVRLIHTQENDKQEQEALLWTDHTCEKVQVALPFGQLLTVLDTGEDIAVVIHEADQDENTEPAECVYSCVHNGTPNNLHERGE